MLRNLNVCYMNLYGILISSYFLFLAPVQPLGINGRNRIVPNNQQTISLPPVSPSPVLNNVQEESTNSDQDDINNPTDRMLLKLKKIFF